MVTEDNGVDGIGGCGAVGMVVGIMKYVLRCLVVGGGCFLGGRL